MYIPAFLRVNKKPRKHNRSPQKRKTWFRAIWQFVFAFTYAARKQHRPFLLQIVACVPSSSESANAHAAHPHLRPLTGITTLLVDAIGNAANSSLLGVIVFSSGWCIP